MIKNLLILLLCTGLIISCANVNNENLNEIYGEISDSEPYQTAILEYPNNPLISDSMGVPVDSLSEYYLPYDTAGPANIEWLYWLQEPILSNYYTGKNVIRLNITYEHSDNVLIRLSFTDDEYELTSYSYALTFKEVLYEDSINNYEIVPLYYPETSNPDGYFLKYKRYSSVLPMDSIARVLEDLEYCDFKNRFHRVKEPEYVGLGTFYDMEVHTSEYYHFVKRRNDTGSISRLVNSLIILAINNGHKLMIGGGVYTIVED